MSRSSSRRKRRARAKRLTALIGPRLVRHLTKCSEKARKLPELHWFTSTAAAVESDAHPEIRMTCQSCGLTYWNAGSKIYVPGKGLFSEPPDVVQILALLGSRSK